MCDCCPSSSPPLPAAAPFTNCSPLPLPLLRPVCSADRPPPVITAGSSLKSLLSLWVLPSTFHSVTRAVFLGGKSDGANCQLPAPFSVVAPRANPPFTSLFLVRCHCSHFPSGFFSHPALQAHGLSFIPMQVAVLSLWFCSQGSALWSTTFLLFKLITLAPLKWCLVTKVFIAWKFDLPPLTQLILASLWVYLITHRCL